ncbi:17122_t:CDS:1 [Funneliformis geosporum]|uniref:3200_t:CDS:1 n=1 Tax=Funneliformis geosporum TaxID=1117311 RepID=A0A9W4WWE7_9GLOM|nr:17122_t:CDS:1 [Funneliformis geosporum]CAI2177207.1 3200_t:CDS:1 [Funneliformis geosporum]
MYTESFDNVSSAELMHYTSTPENTSNADYINNFDFNIYSQPSTQTTDYIENELYHPLPQIGQQVIQLVNQQQNNDVTNFNFFTNNNHLPLDNHIDLSPTEENFHYTTPNQSDFAAASPHGYSENNASTPLLESYTNNGTFSAHSTPVLSSEPLFQDSNSNFLLFSPVVNNYRNLSIKTSPSAFCDLHISDDIGSTPTVPGFGTPYTADYSTVPSRTPLITPQNTPYINTPYVTNSPFSVASTINTPFALPQTPLTVDTPLVEPSGADPNLYDESGKIGSWFNLFAAPSANVLNYSNLKGSPSVYEDNTIYEKTIVPYFDGCYDNNQIVNMATISPEYVGTVASDNGEKKIDTSELVAPGSPNSRQHDVSTFALTDKSSSPNTALGVAAAVEQMSTSPSKSVTEFADLLKVENDQGNLEAVKAEQSLIITHPTQTPDSAPTTPVDAPRLLAIRPHPQDDDDSVENESTRRSKRQRTMSVSEENEEENDDESEKKYNCPDCGRGFNRKFNMQTHRLTHDPNRVKPFACDHPNCGSRFTRKHDLKRHINGIHKGEKVHECTVCRKPFSRKDAWKRHITTCGKM